MNIGKTSDKAIIDVFGKIETEKIAEWKQEQDKKNKYIMLKATILSAYFTIMIFLLLYTIG